MWLRPIEPVIPSSACIRRVRRASITAGGTPCSFSVPVRSMNASSRESGSMAGVISSIIARIRREVSTYTSIRPRTTTASGQSFSAWNIGIAERTPLMRAM